MKTRFLQLAALLLLIFVGYTAQGKGNIVFSKQVHSFGTILESGGSVSYTFQFTNKGNEPVIISNVIASCGCTTPEWPREPVLPGKTGNITATYAPAGRPGAFDKSLTVMSNAEQASIILRITGEVVQKMPSIEEQYPVTIGANLRMKSADVAFARLSKNATETSTLSVYNNGSEPVSITFDKLPAHLSMKVEPATIAPKQQATISCTYQTAKKNDWGYVADVVPFKVSGKKSGNGKLTVSATILDDFSKMSAVELKKAPYPQLRNSTYNFSNVGKGAMVNTSFVVTNSGQTPLIIRKVSSELAYVKVSASKTTVKPGESIEVKVSINTTACEAGVVALPVSIYTNSPRSPQTDLLITGTILN